MPQIRPFRHAKTTTNFNQADATLPELNAQAAPSGERPTRIQNAKSGSISTPVAGRLRGLSRGRVARHQSQPAHGQTRLRRQPHRICKPNPGIPTRNTIDKIQYIRHHVARSEQQKLAHRGRERHQIPRTSRATNPKNYSPISRTNRRTQRKQTRIPNTTHSAFLNHPDTRSPRP